MKQEKLLGIMPALMTAFTDDGTAIDTDRIRRLVRHLVGQGVNGLYVGGSSGEMLLCSTAERQKLLETVVEEVDHKATVIAHVGSGSLNDTLTLVRHACAIGAEAVSSVTPLYFAYTFQDVKHFYEAIAAESTLPVIIYSIPVLTGKTYNFDQLCELLAIPNIGGMKFTCSDFFLLERLRSANPDKVFYNGSDEMLLSGLAAGADGGIGTTYNFQADRMLKIRSLYLEGKMKEALAVQHKANAVIADVLKYGVMPACKEVLKIGGLDYGQCREPFSPLTDEQKLALRKTVIENLGENFMLK